MRHLVFVALACVTSACWVTNISDGERLALLTAQDLAVYGVKVPGPLRESYKRTNTIDGSYSLEYECNGTAPNSTYLAVQIDVEQSAQSARVTMAAKRTVMVGTMRTQGVDVRMDAAAPYGDESYFGSLMKDSTAVGHIVLVRRGVWVYTVVMAGLRVASTKEWPLLLDAKFAHLDSLTARR